MKKLLFLLSVALFTALSLHAAFTPAAFTVSSKGKQVAFSQGNLQYTQSTSTWSFADYQTDMLGTGNVTDGTESYDAYNGYSKNGTALADKIDLFGWSTNNETAQWGISTSTNNSDYAGDFVDWGTNNIGTAVPNTYRTLTNDEWEYLLKTRPNASEKKGVARINLNSDGTQYANGLILLPDSWTCPTDVTFKSGFANSNGEGYYATYQTFTLDQWQKLEAAGAVFLPASGNRHGSSMAVVQSYGSYWSMSTTAHDPDDAYNIDLNSYDAGANYRSLRYRGNAVRLVQDVPTYAITLTQPDHGTIAADKTESVAGETITLTLSPDAYYAPKTVTVLQGETPVTTTAVAGTTNQYTFTMPAGEVTITTEFEKLSSAFTPAAFTIAADGKQVTFSQGNLQCSGLTTQDTTWSFADYQTEMLGEANVSGSALADKIDLFGWSTNNGTTKWGISTSKNNSDYAGDFVDWGINTIGTAAPNTYRTLTNDEWAYLLNTRPNASEKKGVARINLNSDGTQYANGLILLPDSWTCPTDVTFKSGFADSNGEGYYAIYQTFTFDQWQKLESAGAVFLPASDYRSGSSMNEVQNIGDYWSATAEGSNHAYSLYFRSYEAYAGSSFRFYGLAVRLVQDVKYTITLTQPDHGTIAADKTESVAAGETITLTITPNAYCILKTVTVLQGETPVTTTAVVGTTNQYTFTMPAGEVSITAEFEKLSSAFTPAAFTVSSKGKQVAFSQGNLQYTQSTLTWSFADYQTDMLGKANISSGVLADKIDLFGWSGNNTTAPWGISTTTSASNYSGDFVDWGTNTIGTYAPNTYRTLTKDEWLYLFNTRTNASNLKGVARIKLNDDGSQYANGLILLPDDWTCPTDVTFNSGFASDENIEAYATYQTFTLTEWQKLESAGAVFLPASGCRDGSVMYYVQNRGYYRSATANGSEYAYNPSFYSSKIEALSGNRRYYGIAVRLVQDVKYAITLTQPGHGSIAADKTEAAAGETITLTITPNAYCILKTVTVLQGETPVTTTAVVGTTYQYTFIMPAGEVSITAEFEKLSSAFTPAAFTVSESGKQVLFSQGNLQCAGVTSGTYTWSFADYQTEMLGEANVSGSALADKIDLFGWSANNETAKWGISTSTDYNDYAGDFLDWGKNIDDGTIYRTLTNDEWDYLLNTRTNASNLKGVARINLNSDGSQYANGLILLPDSWTCPEGVIFKSGLASEWSIEAYATYQTFTLVEWQKLEAAGAVFLPASGSHDWLRMYNVQRNGVYGSATAYDSLNAYNLSFGSDGVYVGGNGRVYGQAVRLVQDVKYTITLTSPEHGSIAANKTESVAGETITLTITPDTGYELDVLTTKDAAGNPVTVNDNKFTMPASNVTVSATFKLQTFIVTTHAEHGTVTGGGTYDYGTEVELKAEPAANYHFVQWSDGNTANPRTITVTANAEYTAEFAIDQHTITVTAENGTVTGAGTYDYGKEVELKAVPNEHYHFVKWSDGNADATRTITVTANAEYTAEFAIDQHTITVTAENGTVTGAGTYDYGTEVELKAVPAEHYHFVQWSDGNTDVTRTITVTANAEYTAEFAIDQYTITVIAENGTVTGAGTYDYGTEVELKAEPAEHYHFVKWSDEVTDNPRTITVTANAEYTAEFAIDQHTITVTAENGTVTGGGTYDYGTEVTLKAEPAEHYHFVKWSDDVTANPRKITVTANAEYTAEFAIDQYTITVTAENGTVTGAGTYDYGTEVTLEAKPAEHYHFVKWSDGTTENPYSFVITQDITIEAVFVEVPSTVDNIADSAGITIRKVLRNGQVLILRGGKTYTTTGLEVK